ncbi:hypothetical protein OG863_37020 [Streptomyces decoyicus]|uniref:Proline-rich protein n=1 Tax=Streptomyces decoyicus TaxID=249567 RepID=A0ABZ1FRX5_9ACTN|nr:hypothetical protein [Streptomyces decoyicus]WSB73115.1 hypothetical protein OG863_37020 [Streptomyces decoyicus]
MTGAGAAALPWPPAGPAPDMAEWSRVPQLWLVQAPEAGAPLDVSVLDKGERGRAAALRRPKATGAGISGTSLRTLRLGTGPLRAGFAGWELTDVRVPPGHAAACAVREEEPSGERDRSAP